MPSPDRSRWVPVGWEALPGFADDRSDDRSADVWPALLRGCDRPPAA